MSKRNLLNLALLAFIAILAALVIYEPGKEVAKTPTKLTELTKNDIQTITIKRYGSDKSEQQLEFKKTASGWEMHKPYSMPANTFRIDSILEILSSVSFSQNNLKGLNLNNFGLKKPLVAIIFNNKTSIIFGNNKSLKNHRYLQIGSTLHMSGDTFFYQLVAKAESYINHNIINTNSKIKKIVLPAMTLEKTNGAWKQSPKTNDFSADAANQLIDEWKLSQAYDVNKIKTASNAKADIMIHFEDDNKINFKIENNNSSFNLINLDLGVRYILSSDRKDKLLSLTNNFQDAQ